LASIFKQLDISKITITFPSQDIFQIFAVKRVSFGIL